MSTQETIAVVYDEVLPDARPDEMDCIIEADTVTKALHCLGYPTVRLPFSLDIQKHITELEAIKPACIFNLVESLAGKGNFIHLPVQIFEYLHIPHTGAGSEALFVTSNKILTKKLLSLHAIPTPAWQTLDEIDKQGLTVKLPCILKPVCEDASIEIHDNSIFYNTESLIHTVGKISRREQHEYFIEHYIEGREINISMLANGGGPQILPPAEILFNDFPSDKPRIVGYDAKWNHNSFEYIHTPRTFAFSDGDLLLLERMKHIAQRCWHLFQLKAYARVDFRVDQNGVPWVLEINANPCISPDSGFIAAADKAGIAPYENSIKRIIEDAVQ